MLRMLAKVKIDVVSVPETQTALYTMWIKAQDAIQPDSKLNDKWATHSVDRIDNCNLPKFSVETASARFIPARSRLLDKWTTNFLDQQKSAIIVNLACGLERRALRFLLDYTEVRWIDVD
jgi:O-methyltransferase involved in polyketide biosynthesis